MILMKYILMMQTGCKAWQEINFFCKPFLCFQDANELLAVLEDCTISSCTPEIQPTRGCTQENCSCPRRQVPFITPPPAFSPRLPAVGVLVQTGHWCTCYFIEAAAARSYRTWHSCSLSSVRASRAPPYRTAGGC